MMHVHRRHALKEVSTPEEAARLLFEHSWTLCTGFRIPRPGDPLGDLLLLNDATSEMGAQEYAVLRDGHQIESLTVSWMTQEQLTRVLTDLLAGVGGTDMGPCSHRPHPDGDCPFCA